MSDNLVTLIQKALKTHEDKLFLEHWQPTSQKRLTAHEFHQQVMALAAWLRSIGINKGDRVAIHGENSLEWLIADLAIMAAGAVCVPIYAIIPEKDWRYILQHAQAKAIFIYGARRLKALKDKRDEFPDLQQIIFMGGRNQPDSPEGFITIEAAIAQGSTLPSPLIDIQPSDLAILSYTSGTTGIPKGVMLSHKNICHSVNAPMGRAFHRQNPEDSDVVLSFLPFAHIFEHSIIYSYITTGTPIYILSETEHLRPALKAVQPVHFTTVPRLLERIYNEIHNAPLSGTKKSLMRWALRQAKKQGIRKKRSWLGRLADIFVYRHIRAFFGGKLRGISSGGAALSADIMKFFNGVGVPVAEGYGLTETSPCISAYDPKDLRPACVGKPFEGVEVRLSDEQEIMVRGDNVMQGYYLNPEETAKVLKDSWFYTGDLGRFDEDGNLYIIGRNKELFKLSIGKYVSPVPLETTLEASPIIEQAIIIGAGQAYTAALIYPSSLIQTLPKKEQEKQIQQQIHITNRRFPRWEQVRKFRLLPEILSIENNMLTPTLKKKRYIIQKHYIDLIEELYNEG